MDYPGVPDCSLPGFDWFLPQQHQQPEPHPGQPGQLRSPSSASNDILLCSQVNCPTMPDSVTPAAQEQPTVSRERIPVSNPLMKATRALCDAMPYKSGVRDSRLLSVPALAESRRLSRRQLADACSVLSGAGVARKYDSSGQYLWYGRRYLTGCLCALHNSALWDGYPAVLRQLQSANSTALNFVGSSSSVTFNPQADGDDLLPCIGPASSADHETTLYRLCQATLKLLLLARPDEQLPLDLLADFVVRAGLAKPSQIRRIGDVAGVLVGFGLARLLPAGGACGASRGLQLHPELEEAVRLQTVTSGADPAAAPAVASTSAASSVDAVVASQGQLPFIEVEGTITGPNKVRLSLGTVLQLVSSVAGAAKVSASTQYSPQKEPPPNPTSASSMLSATTQSTHSPSRPSAHQQPQHRQQLSTPPSSSVVAVSDLFADSTPPPGFTEADAQDVSCLSDCPIDLEDLFSTSPRKLMMPTSAAASAVSASAVAVSASGSAGTSGSSAGSSAGLDAALAEMLGCCSDSSLQSAAARDPLDFAAQLSGVSSLASSSPSQPPLPPASTTAAAMSAAVPPVASAATPSAVTLHYPQARADSVGTSAACALPSAVKAVSLAQSRSAEFGLTSLPQSCGDRRPLVPKLPRISVRLHLTVPPQPPCRHALAAAENAAAAAAASKQSRRATPRRISPKPASMSDDPSASVQPPASKRVALDESEPVSAATFNELLAATSQRKLGPNTRVVLTGSGGRGGGVSYVRFVRPPAAAVAKPRAPSTQPVLLVARKAEKLES